MHEHFHDDYRISGFSFLVEFPVKGFQAIEG